MFDDFLLMIKDLQQECDSEFIFVEVTQFVVSLFMKMFQVIIETFKTVEDKLHIIGEIFFINIEPILLCETNMILNRHE